MTLTALPGHWINYRIGRLCPRISTPQQKYHLSTPQQKYPPSSFWFRCATDVKSISRLNGPPDGSSANRRQRCQHWNVGQGAWRQQAARAERQLRNNKQTHGSLAPAHTPSVAFRHLLPIADSFLVKCCLMSSDVSWHIRGRLWPMPKHGSITVYVHGNQKAR